MSLPSPRAETLRVVKTVEVDAFVVILVGADRRRPSGRSSRPVDLLGDDIQGLYAVAVIDAGEFALVVEVVEDLVAFDDVGGYVAGGEFRVIIEEPFAIYEDTGNGFALCGDVAAAIDRHARQLVQQVFRHGVGFGREHARIVFHRILLDPHGWALDDDLLQDVGSVLHIDGGEVNISRSGVDGESADDVVVAFEGDEEVVITGAEVAEAEIAVLVGYGIFSVGCIRFGGDADGGVAKHLFGAGVGDLSLHGALDLSLSEGRMAEPEADKEEQ